MSSSPDHLCKIYFIVLPDDFERGEVFREILSHLKGEVQRFDAEKTEQGQVFDALESFQFFADPIVVLDGVEKWGKKERKNLCRHFDPTGFFLLGARAKVPEILEEAEKKGVVFDLSLEKPWDREKRLLTMLREKVVQEGKKWELGALELLVEKVGLDFSFLLRESEKLITYVGEKSSLTKEDVDRVCFPSKNATVWQLAEALVWEGKKVSFCDEAFFHRFLPAVRNQLHIGLVLATCIREKTPLSECSSFLPKIFPKTLEKRSAHALKLGEGYFRRGLKTLFTIELKSRTYSGDFSALLELFQGKLHAG